MQVFNKPPTLHRYWEPIIYFNRQNRVRCVVLGLLQDGACTVFFENLRENTLKGDLSNATTFKPPLFSLVDTFKYKTSVIVIIQLAEVIVHLRTRNGGMKAVPRVR
jgi:hypothetical protein